MPDVCRSTRAVQLPACAVKKVRLLMVQGAPGWVLIKGQRSSSRSGESRRTASTAVRVSAGVPAVPSGSRTGAGRIHSSRGEPSLKRSHCMVLTRDRTRRSPVSKQHRKTRRNVRLGGMTTRSGGLRICVTSQRTAQPPFESRKALIRPVRPLSSSREVARMDGIGRACSSLLRPN